eukprot:8917111-Ditylum_brightwellii.AAC.1
MDSQLFQSAYASPLDLKLESQKIVELLGKNEEWQMWKPHMQCTFDVSGYERVLLDREYVVRRQDLNRIVYLQLSIALAGGTAHHLIKQF